MKIVFKKSFVKDLRHINDRLILQPVKDIIGDIENSQRLGDIKNLKKLTGE